MKSLLSLVAVGTLFFGVSAAHASPELAQKKNCMACHAATQKVIGPSYKDVAAKYAGQKDAAAMLATKVMKGGVGTWGQIPMPANPQVSQAEANQLVAWILATPQ